MDSSAALVILLAGVWLVVSFLSALVLAPLVAAGETEFRRRSLHAKPLKLDLAHVA